MYLRKPFLELCNKHNFEYIIRYKESDVTSIKRNFDEIKIIDESYEYQNEIIFGELKNKEFYTVNVISYDEKSKDEDTGEVITTNFSYVTSLKITQKNKEKILLLGRKRWKIENKGFKEQKSDILNIKHIYTKRCECTKNIYLIIQIAHTLLNLLNYGNILIIGLNTTKNEVSDLIEKALTSVTNHLNLNRKIQLRLP